MVCIMKLKLYFYQFETVTNHLLGTSAPKSRKRSEGIDNCPHYFPDKITSTAIPAYFLLNFILVYFRRPCKFTMICVLKLNLIPNVILFLSNNNNKTKFRRNALLTYFVYVVQYIRLINNFHF